MYEELRALDVENKKNIEEIVALLAFAKVFKAEFDSEQLPTPEWLDDRIRSIKRELQARNADQKAKTLRELRSQRDNLLTAAEKRQKIDQQIAQLEAAGVV